MKRTISGIVYVIIITLAFVIRQLVDYRIFNILLLTLSVFGALEMAVETKKFVGKGISRCSFVFGVLLVPVFFLAETLLPTFGWIFGVGLIAFSLILNVILELVYRRRADAMLFSILDALYPSVFILIMLLCNELGDGRGFIALLLLFVVSACADTLEFFVGCIFKGPKLCPSLSPKKTWSGAIGGLIGGAIGGLLVYLVFGHALGGNFYWWVFLLVGVVGAVLSILGDLFESYIKRKIGIKDMGNIIPGHGGVLDRIDGLMFITLLVYPLMLLL